MFTLRAKWRFVKIGYKSDSLEVIGVQFRLHAAGKPKWACVVRCKCGVCKVVLVGDLARRFQKSCGCHRVDVAASMGKKNTTHGMTATRLYTVWRDMKARCDNPRQDGYADYGGRGISVCSEWDARFETFAEWAIDNGYVDDLQIDRIDTNGNYEPFNCRFVTCLENNNNRRNTPFVRAFGEIKSLADWGRDSRCAISYAELWRRLFGKGRTMQWTAEEAIATPPLPQRMRQAARPPGGGTCRS